MFSNVPVAVSFVVFLGPGQTPILIQSNRTATQKEIKKTKRSCWAVVFQGKINVSPAVQFTVTVTRTLIVNDACIYKKHVRAQNKGSHVGKQTEIEADSYLNMT